MGLKLQNFLGRDLVIPGDRLYEPIEGLWVRNLNDGRVEVGMTEPTVLMAGAVRELEILVEDDSRVSKGETVILVLTAKLKYLASPIGGRLGVPRDMASLPQRIAEDPYGSTLFYLMPEEHGISHLVDAAGYVKALHDCDGSRNPGGHKGGVSPTCKAVYMALGDQSLKE